MSSNRAYFAKGYLQAVDQAGGSFIVRGKPSSNPLIPKAIGSDGREVTAFRQRRLKEVKEQLTQYACLDMTVSFDSRSEPFDCRLVVHPNIRANEAPRYLLTNPDPEAFSPEQVSDGYRLGWQIELLFKEWKLRANLHAFDTANANIAVGLAARGDGQVLLYDVTQRITQLAISTRIVAKSICRDQSDIIYDLMHERQRVKSSVERAIDYLSRNARRTHPERDRRSGRLKPGLQHIYAEA